VPEGSLLTRTWSARIAESGRTIAAQIRNDDTPSGGGKRGRDAIVSMHVIRKPVHQDDRGAIHWTKFLVGDLQCRSQDGLHIPSAPYTDNFGTDRFGLWKGKLKTPLQNLLFGGCHW
jgi:hypothetical protein